MYCMNCGYSLPDSANFCLNCGTATKVERKVAIPKEWEFTYFELQYDDGGVFYLTHGSTEESIRAEQWNSEKSSILPQIQEYFDDGWELLSDLGENSYRLSRLRDKDGYPYLSVSSFFVELQRPARELTSLEKAILGTWEEDDDPNRGLMPLLNLITMGTGEASKVQYEFLKNKTYHWKNRAGEEVNQGVFKDLGNGQIELLPKFHEETNDKYAKLENEKLVIARKYPLDRQLKEFRLVRASQNKTG